MDWSHAMCMYCDGWMLPLYIIRNTVYPRLEEDSGGCEKSGFRRRWGDLSGHRLLHTSAKEAVVVTTCVLFSTVLHR